MIPTIGNWELAIGNVFYELKKQTLIQLSDLCRSPRGSWRLERLASSRDDLQFYYSVRKLLTGFMIAARSAWSVIVINANVIADSPAIRNTNHPICIL